ncbi:MAG TPA: GNAT family N-acetyltransferase [Polyangia bacterium]|nr:GNAT family N-acetyltransferase [Polyangia bacterium]
MIRRARDQDGAAARELWREADLHHAAIAPGYFRASSHAAREWDALLADRDAAVFVADDPLGPSVIGLAIARLHDTPPDPSLVPLRRAHVELVVVARSARRRGVGRRLMEETALWARRNGAAEIVLTVWAGNAEAEGFYERLGFNVLSRALHARL